MDDQILRQEMDQTVNELAGAPFDQVVGALAGTIVAAFRELYARVDVLEKIVLAAGEENVENAGLVELPAPGALVGDEAPRGQVVFAPPVSTAPPESSGDQTVALIAPPVQTTRDEVLRRRAASVEVPAPAPTSVPAPAVVASGLTPLEALRAERQALETRIAQLRQRAAAAVAAPSPTLVPAAAPTPWTGSLPYEIRHVDGPLIGRSDVVGMPLEHATIEAAQAAMNLIMASKPGWRDRLAIFDRRLP